jgi:hypothetical protein
MLELLGLMALIVIIGAVAVGLLKMLFWLLVLPFKLGFWLLKGVFALVFIVPLAVISLCVATAVLPAIALVIALPVFLLVGGLVVLVRAFA